MDVPSIILILCGVTLFSECQGKTQFYYAVQVEPVVFVIHPQSLVISKYGSFTLSCQARVAQIVDKSIPLPEINWYRDGLLIRGDSIKTNSSIGYSELTVKNAMTSNKYECMAIDAEGHYITISEPGHILVPDTKLDGYNVTTEVFQSLVMNCQMPVKYWNVSWLHNGIHLSNNEDIIITSNNSIVIFTVSLNDTGIWDCIAHSSNGSVFVLTSYFLNVTDRQDNADCDNETNLILIDVDPVIVHPGDQVLVTCITNHDDDEISQIYLLLNNQIIWFWQWNIGNTVRYLINDVELQHAGSYMCQVMLNSGYVTNSSIHNLIVINSSFPVINDVYLPYMSQFVVIVCVTDNYYSTDGQITWFKNGRHLGTRHSNNTLELTSDDNIFGVYQCFSGDIMLNLTRVLVKDLSNPVGDISVDVIFRNLDIVSMNVSWTPPIQRGGNPSLVYNIVIFYLDLDYFSYNTLKNIIHSDGTNYHHFKFSRPDFRLYKYYISIDIIRGGVGGLSSIEYCVDSMIPYFLQDIQPLFEMDKDGNVTITWYSPSPRPSEHSIDYVTFNLTCLYEDIIESHQSYIEHFNAAVYTYTTDVLPEGTVCLFTGKYKTPIDRCSGNQIRKIITPATFQVPVVSEDQDSLNLSLNMSHVTNDVVLYWQIQESFFCKLIREISSVLLKFSGICLNNNNEVHTFNRNITVVDVRDGILVAFTNMSMINSFVCTFVFAIDEMPFNSTPVQVVISESLDTNIVEEFKITAQQVECSPISASSITLKATPSNSTIHHINKSPTESYIPTIPTTPSNSTIHHINKSPTESYIPTIPNEDNSTVTFLSIILISALGVLMLIVAILIFLVLRKERKKRMLKLKMEESDSGHLNHWNNSYDGVSIKTDIQSPCYEGSIPFDCNSTSISMSLDDFYNLVNDAVHLAHPNGETFDTTSLLSITDTMTGSAPENDHLSEAFETNDQMKCNTTTQTVESLCSQCSSTLLDIRISETGLTFQVDVPHPFMDNTGCSSGYGSDITSVQVQSDEYHRHLEPDLIEVEEQDSNEGHSCNGYDDDPESSSFVNKPLTKVSSCPNMTELCHYQYNLHKDDCFLEQHCFTHNKPATNYDRQAVTITNIGDSSSESLSSGKATYLNVNDGQLNVLYVDDKGYTHILCAEKFY